LYPGHEDDLAFYLLDYSLYPIFDGRLVDAIRKEGLRGLVFSPPLQLPGKRDVRSYYIMSREYREEKAAL